MLAIRYLRTLFAVTIVFIVFFDPVVLAFVLSVIGIEGSQNQGLYNYMYLRLYLQCSLIRHCLCTDGQLDSGASQHQTLVLDKCQL
jgi:hypothetical protein